MKTGTPSSLAVLTALLRAWCETLLVKITTPSDFLILEHMLC